MKRRALVTRMSSHNAVTRNVMYAMLNVFFCRATARPIAIGASEIRDRGNVKIPAPTIKRDALKRLTCLFVLSVRIGI